ncbi:MAG: DUF6702 family protein [Pseudohongiellaceae bacterium]
MTTATSSLSRVARHAAHGLCLMMCGLVVVVSPAVQAHQQKAAVTRVLFNQRTGNIEVMHRFDLHDAEHALTLLFDTQPGLMESEQSRELFAGYIVNRFSMEALDGGGDIRMPLAFVGQEVDGRYLWVYQETPIPRSLQGLTIVNVALRDVWADQSNLVNIEREAELISLTFEGDKEELSVRFSIQQE